MGPPQKSRAPVEEPNIEDGNPPADWEFIKSVLKLFTDISLDKLAYQSQNCLESNLMEHLYKEKDKPEGLTGEKLTDVIKCIVMKGENVWGQRKKLHQMTQETGETVSRFAARLRPSQLVWICNDMPRRQMQPTQ